MVLKVLILLVIIPLLLWKGWSIYVEKLDLNQQFKLSDIKLKEIPGIAHGTSGKKYQIQTVSNYIGAIKAANLTTSDIIKLSYIQSIALVLLLICLIWNFGKKLFCKGELFLLAITLSIGYVGYAFVLLVMYVFSFGPIEGPVLASFDRYMDTYILLCMFVIIILFIFTDSKKDKNVKSLKYVFIIFLVMLIIQSPGKITNCFPMAYSKDMSDFQKHALNISKNTEKNSKIFIIAQDSNGGQQYVIKYYMNPRITNLKKYNFPVKKNINYENYFNENINNYMLKFDYLYLVNINKKFINRYNFLFPDDDIKETNLYKIKNNNGKVKLEKVS